MNMIPPDVWCRNVRSVIQKLASEEFQKSAWFERGKSNVFSPDELVTSFFDDLFFDEFLTSLEVNLNDIQRQAGVELQTKLNEFCSATPPHLEPEFLIRDPRWHQITILAQNFLATLENYTC